MRYEKQSQILPSSISPSGPIPYFSNFPQNEISAAVITIERGVISRCRCMEFNVLKSDLIESNNLYVVSELLVNASGVLIEVIVM